MSCGRNPFPDPLLLTVVLTIPGEQRIGEVNREDGHEAQSAQSSGGKGNESSRANEFRAGSRMSFALLLKKTTDLVLQPFQSLQV